MRSSAPADARIGVHNQHVLILALRLLRAARPELCSFLELLDVAFLAMTMVPINWNKKKFALSDSESSAEKRPTAPAQVRRDQLVEIERLAARCSVLDLC